MKPSCSHNPSFTLDSLRTRQCSHVTPSEHMLTCTRLHLQSVSTPARQHPRSSPKAQPPLPRPPPPPPASSCLPLLRLMTQRAAPRFLRKIKFRTQPRGRGTLAHSELPYLFFVLRFGSLLLVEPLLISPTFADRAPSFRRAGKSTAAPPRYGWAGEPRQITRLRFVGNHSVTTYFFRWPFYGTALLRL